MKILCVCAEGIVRSATTRIVLNSRNKGHDVIAVGVNQQSKETLAMLYGWADKILLAEPSMGLAFDWSGVSKIDHRFTIGPDDWGVFNDPELVKIIQDKLMEIG